MEKSIKILKVAKEELELAGDLQEAIHKKMKQVEIDFRNKKKMTTDTTTRIWWEHEYKAQMEVLSELLKEVEND